MEKPTKAFTNWRGGAFYLKFPNGNELSTTFASGSYSENHDLDRNFESWKSLEKPVESNTVEIMVLKCPDILYKKIYKKYGDEGNSVIGYLTMTQWLEIVALLSKPLATNSNK